MSRDFLIIDLCMHREEKPSGWFTVNHPLQTVVYSKPLAAERVVYCRPPAWLFFSMYVELRIKESQVPIHPYHPPPSPIHTTDLIYETQGGRAVEGVNQRNSKRPEKAYKDSKAFATVS